MRQLTVLVALVALVCLLPWQVDAAEPARGTYAVGVAAVDVTPRYNVRLSGFGFRRAESEGVTQKVWAKALGTRGSSQAPVLSRDGTRLYLADSVGALRVLNAATGDEELKTTSLGTTVDSTVALNHDETVAYALDNDGRYIRYDLTEKTATEVARTNGSYGGFVLSEDGQFGYHVTHRNSELQAVRLEAP